MFEQIEEEPANLKDDLLNHLQQQRSNLRGRKEEEEEEEEGEEVNLFADGTQGREYFEKREKEIYGEVCDLEGGINDVDDSGR